MRMVHRFLSCVLGLAVLGLPNGSLFGFNQIHRACQRDRPARDVLFQQHLKGELSRPLNVSGPVAAGATLRLVATTLSGSATLTVSDGAGRELWRQQLSAGPEQGPWRKTTRDDHWQTWRAEGEVEFRVKLAGRSIVILGKRKHEI
jgi:hypothetical protein